MNTTRVNKTKTRTTMIIVKEIRITGITKLKVNTEVENIKAFRKECAQTYRVRLSDVKFVYEERD